MLPVDFTVCSWVRTFIPARRASQRAEFFTPKRIIKIDSMYIGYLPKSSIRAENPADLKVKVMNDSANNELALAVETSGPTGSVAVGIGDKILAETAFSGIMTHSAELFPAADAILKRFDKHIDDLAHIYIAVGPGSFTGLRIAVTTAKMMALANGVKIVTANTMDVLTFNAS